MLSPPPRRRGSAIRGSGIPLGVGELTAGDLVLGVNVPADASAAVPSCSTRRARRAVALKGDATDPARSDRRGPRSQDRTDGSGARRVVGPGVPLVLNAATNVDRSVRRADTDGRSVRARQCDGGHDRRGRDDRRPTRSSAGLLQPRPADRRSSPRHDPRPHRIRSLVAGVSRRRLLPPAVDGAGRGRADHGSHAASSATGWRRSSRPAPRCWVRSGSSKATTRWVPRPSRPCARRLRSRRCTCCVSERSSIRVAANAERSCAHARGRARRDRLPERCSASTSTRRAPLSRSIWSPSTMTMSSCRSAASRVIDAITVACEAFRRRVVCTWIGQTIYALFPSTTRDSPARLDVDRGGHLLPLRRATAGPSRRRVSARSARVWAALASAAAKPTGSYGSSRHARPDVRCHDRRGACGEHPADARGPHRIAPDLRLPGIDRLIAHDAEHSKTYMQTLRAFIDASGNVAAVATRLNLHTNTVRYRVRRLGEISGLDLDDPEHRLGGRDRPPEPSRGPE